MKDAATHSYLKKGQNVVDMNYKAPMPVLLVFKKIETPADWAVAQMPNPHLFEGRAASLKQVQKSEPCVLHGRRFLACFRV